MRYEVIITEIQTNKIIKRMSCNSEREAEKVWRGVLTQLNHADYAAYYKEVE